MTEIHSVYKNVFPKITAIISEQRSQDLSGAVVCSFKLNILPKTSRKIVSESTLYSGHFLWKNFLQKLTFWALCFNSKQ